MGGLGDDGEPSPLQVEIDVIQPRFALSTTAPTTWALVQHTVPRCGCSDTSDLLDVLGGRVVPILIGISARLDNPSADLRPLAM